MGILERAVRGVVYTTRLICGLVYYLATKKTPPFAYQSMVSLFCMTHGRSNDLLSRLIGVFKRPYRFSSARGLLGDMAQPEARNKVTEQLRTRGYYVFERCVPPELCDKLLQYAVTHPCTTRRMDGGKLGAQIRAVYPRSSPEAVRYDFDMQELLRNQDVQKMLADLSFVALAQDYLGARPTVDVLGMWWHTAFSDVPDSEAAQYFHFDMDRPKWLKFFIYLTDVEEQNGPHSFIAGSHRTGGIPQHLLAKGYSRLQDAEVSEAFGRSDYREFTAPRGSIIVEDTRGLHKGRHVESGDRLMLQIQFSNSLFGGFYPKARLGEDLCAELRSRVQQYPALYSAFLT